MLTATSGMFPPKEWTWTIPNLELNYISKNRKTRSRHHNFFEIPFFRPKKLTPKIKKFFFLNFWQFGFLTQKNLTQKKRKNLTKNFLWPKYWFLKRKLLWKFIFDQNLIFWPKFLFSPFLKYLFSGPSN